MDTRAMALNIVNQMNEEQLRGFVSLFQGLFNNIPERKTVADDKRNSLSQEERLLLMKKVRGSLSQYAKKGMSIDEIMKMEKGAWKEAVIKKYGNI